MRCFGRSSGVEFLSRKKTELTNCSDYASSACYFAVDDRLCSAASFSYIFKQKILKAKDMMKNDLRQEKFKDILHKNYLAPIIVGILVTLITCFFINSYLENEKAKEEIDYHFNQASNFLNQNEFEEAIAEYNEILKISYNNFPDKYAKAQLYLGKAYGSLANVKNEETNNQNAINACQEALKVYTFDKYPYEYANTQYNLANVYYALANVRDKEGNAQKSINACQEALKVFTVDKYPYEYAITQTVLGTAYYDLAQVRDREVNAQNSINASQKALEVYTIDKYPTRYAITEANLEKAKRLLAQTKN